MKRLTRRLGVLTFTAAIAGMVGGVLPASAAPTTDVITYFGPNYIASGTPSDGQGVDIRVLDDNTGTVQLDGKVPRIFSHVKADFRGGLVCDRGSCYGSVTMDGVSYQANGFVSHTATTESFIGWLLNVQGKNALILATDITR